MKERLKELRKALNLTQQELADQLHIKRTNIGNYESGVSSPTDSVIALICREFNVSEDWFRNGIGDMFVPAPTDDEIDSFVSKVKKDSGFKKCFLSTLSKMDESEWDFVEKFMKNVLEEAGTI
jgi:hypothetical protein